MAILVTGVAGFIGSHVAKTLLARGNAVVGVDSLNDYYDVTLKHKRLERLKKWPGFTFHHINIADYGSVSRLSQEHPEIHGIVHLAAQAGVRYSLTHPFAYVEANLQGHLSMLEFARHHRGIRHMVYASSSSVYGANTKMPFAVEDRTDSPLALYAATKKSNELMSQSYAHLFKIPLSGLRYFTVYGPWGRPDMSAFLFAKSILAGEEFPVFNHGDMRRNYTYIQDIVNGTIGCLDHPQTHDVPHKIYNIGNDQSESLLNFIQILEELLGKKARMRMEPMQPGDVKETIADVTPAFQDFGFRPQTDVREGLQNFVAWYLEHFATAA